MDPFPMTVLLATDGSEEAGLASRMAAALATRTGSELHIVCVVDLGAATAQRTPPHVGDSEQLLYSDSSVEGPKGHRGSGELPRWT